MRHNCIFVLMFGYILKHNVEWFLNRCVLFKVSIVC